MEKYYECCPFCGYKPEDEGLESFYHHACYICKRTYNGLYKWLYERNLEEEHKLFRNPYDKYGLVTYVSQHYISYYEEMAEKKYGNRKRAYEFFVNTELSKLNVFSWEYYRSLHRKLDTESELNRMENIQVIHCDRIIDDEYEDDEPEE